MKEKEVEKDGLTTKVHTVYSATTMIEEGEIRHSPKKTLTARAGDEFDSIIPSIMLLPFREDDLELATYLDGLSSNDLSDSVNM